MRTLLAHATVITMNPARDVLDTDILIENGVIADMGPGLAGRPENAGAERVDLSGRIVIPGLIQSHMHVTQSLFRGLADEMELMDWLQRRIWPLEGAHTPETNAAAARLAENQTSLVPLDRRDGEAGNVLVIERMARLDPVGEIAQPRAEHDAHLGREISGRGPDERGGFLNFL